MNASACRSPAKVRRGCFTIAIDCRSDIAARRSGSTRMVICFMFSSGTGFEPAAATRVFTYTWREAAGPRMIWIREGSNQWGRAISLIRPQGDRGGAVLGRFPYLPAILQYRRGPD